MTMITPERAANAAAKANLNIVHSASECSELLEEKKSVDAMDQIVSSFKEVVPVVAAGQKQPVYRHKISNEPGSKFLPEKGRYVLYASRACPESHRALLVRTMKGLEEVVTVKFVYPKAGNNLLRNWVVAQEDISEDDSMTSCKSDDPETIRDLYQKENDSISNIIPLLYDLEHQCIVNNNANDVAWMLNSCFNEHCKNPQLELFPSELPKQQQELQDWLYPLLQLAPSSLPPYHYAVSPLELEYAFERATSILQKQRYLLSHSTVTEADLRLFVALVRYDAVYAKYLECPPQLLHNPALLDYCRDIYQQAGVADTVRMDEIRAHFMGGRRMSNPQDEAMLAQFKAPHKRDQM